LNDFICYYKLLTNNPLLTAGGKHITRPCLQEITRQSKSSLLLTQTIALSIERDPIDCQIRE